jgi:hypothetical protein
MAGAFKNSCEYAIVKARKANLCASGFDHSGPDALIQTFAAR